MTDVYSRWKGWTDDAAFGHAKRGDDAYFLSELRDGGPLPKGAAVLEIGYGNGEFLDVARRQGWDVTGTELLPDLVEKARAAGFAAVAADRVGDLPDAGFDLIVAFDVLEHIPPEDTISFLGELVRTLKPNGTMILRYPNGDSALGNPFQNGDPTHVNAIGWLKMEFYASEAGLRITKYRGVRRRGFATSAVHGIHRLTAGVYATISGSVRRAIYLPALPVVLSSGNVVCILRRAAA